MKTVVTRSPIVLGTTILLFLGGLTIANIFAKSRPSDLLSEDTSYSTTFVLKPMEDMRLLYTDKNIIEKRRQEKVCAVDAFFESKWRVNFALSTNTTLSMVLDSIGLTNWHGGRQIRVIKRNSISQSEYPVMRENARRAFEETPIEPADIVVICPYEDW